MQELRDDMTPYERFAIQVRNTPGGFTRVYGLRGKGFKADDMMRLAKSPPDVCPLCGHKPWNNTECDLCEICERLDT